MSPSIGVLAAIDCAFDVLEVRGARATADELKEARAAVAELIEAAQEAQFRLSDAEAILRMAALLGACEPAAGQTQPKVKAAYARIHAALARVKGGAK